MTTKTWTGHVTATDSMFKTAEDGTVSFRPINSSYGLFHPAPAPGGETDPNACILELREGEFFQVLEDTDKTEGRGGLRAVANYTDYPSAYRASKGLGAQGSPGYIDIMSPSMEDIVAIAEDGSTVVVGTTQTWTKTAVASRLIFPNRQPRAQLRELLATTLGLDTEQAEKGADAVLAWLESRTQKKG